MSTSQDAYLSIHSTVTIIQSMAEASNGSKEEFNFTDFIVEASKIEQRVRIESKGHMPRPIEMKERERK